MQVNLEKIKLKIKFKIILKNRTVKILRYDFEVKVYFGHLVNSLLFELRNLEVVNLIYYKFQKIH